jgi:uncharacterized protein YceK
MRQTTWILLSLIAIAALTLAGCATIASGTKQSLSITSNINDAEVYLDGEKIGTTPYTGTVKKNGEMLRIEKEGYRTETVTLSKTLDPVFWGNIILGGTVGSITDFASGAAYTYAPATYQVDLKDENMAADDYRHELVVRKFAMLYIDEISRDIGAGGGDYVDSLLDLIHDKHEEVVTVEAISEALRRSEGDPVRFGRAAVDLI